MNPKSEKSLPDWLPFVIGFLLVIQFAGLGAWQVQRGLEKRAQQELFSDDSGFTQWSAGMPVRSFQRLKASGLFDNERQFLLDNIIINSRLGYYVITPLDTGDNAALLLVNRGWIEKTGADVGRSTVAVSDTSVTVRGRAGSLPRAGYKMGAAIPADANWPKFAVYPNLEELANELGRDVQPFVLLLDPDDEHGYLRHWVPEEMGPARHFAYALQWFAMGAVLAALLAWHYRRRRQPHD